MILYFTGTGNSEYIAEGLADRLDDQVVSLNLQIKNQIAGEFVSSKPFVIVSPVYAWGVPKLVCDYLASCRLCGSKKLYFVLTMGGGMGNASKFCKQVCARTGMTYMGTASIIMPNNYIVAGGLPTKDEIETTLAAAAGRMDLIAERLRNESSLDKEPIGFFGKILSGPVHNMFSKYSNDKEFQVTQDCIGCGTCVQACPTNNISLENQVATWNHGTCINCYSCINRCPKEAIEIGNKTKGKPRYICPSYHR